ncbi:unnamed protein product, partial [marine sediment metagenome]
TGACTLYVLSLQPVASTLAYLLEKDCTPPLGEELSKIDVIVILGGGVLPSWSLRKEAEPSGVTYSRVANGVEFFNRCRAEYMVVSGGAGPFGKETNAEVMKELAVELGVPPERILVEPYSSTTWEHPRELTNLLEESEEEITIGLVTSALHMGRSLMVFKRYFPNVVPLPCNYRSNPVRLNEYLIIPSADAFLLSTNAFHELIGIVWYKVRMI